MISPESIAAIFDVPVEELMENWRQEYMVPKLTKALFLVAVQKQYEEWLRVWATNIVIVGGPFGRPKPI